MVDRILVFGLFVTTCGCHGPSTNLPTFPAPAVGQQLMIGPFDVPTEIQLCRTVKLDNDEPVAVNRIQVVMAQGSHHFILFRSREDFPDQVFNCWGTVNFDDWEFLMDVNKAGGADWTLDEGQAFVMRPHQQIMMQSHFLNAVGGSVQSPNGGYAFANLYEVPLAKVQHPLYGQFTVDTRINIPPQAYYTTNRTCTFTTSVSLVAMTGHFHARGLEFAVSRTYDGTLMDQIYDSTSWDSPVFELFHPARELIGFDEGVNFSCSYFNYTNDPIGWGGHAEVQEHCNLFFQFYYSYPEEAPDGAKPNPLRCREGSGGW
jgi:hypothetical protein